MPIEISPCELCKEEGRSGRMEVLPGQTIENHLVVYACKHCDGDIFEIADMDNRE